MSSISGDHVNSTPSTSENEILVQKGKFRTPCGLCEGDHRLPRCPFLNEAKRVLHNRPASPQRVPLGYKKFSPSPLLVENLTDLTKPLVKKPIVESKSSESTLEQSQQVKITVDPVLPSDDIIPKESENDTVQILFFNSEPDELGGNLLVPSQQEENSPFPIA